MIPMRENRVRCVDRIRRYDLGEPISVSLSMDEEWTPRIQGQIVVPAQVLAERARPAGNTKLGILQGDTISIALETRYGPSFTTADITAHSGALPASSAAMTELFTTMWNPTEHIASTQEMTLRWGGRGAEVTAEFAPEVSSARLTAALRVPGGSHLVQHTDRMLVELRIRKTAPNLDGTVTLELASEEVRLQDYRRTIPTTWVSTFTQLRDLVGWVLEKIALVAPMMSVVQLTPGPTVTIPSGQTWATGQTAWEFLHPILESTGWSLYCDESGAYRLEPRVTTVAPIELSVDRNVLDLEYDDDPSGDWYDGAVIEYTDADPLTPAQRFDVYAPWSTRITHETRPGVNTSPGAAQRLVERSQTRRHTGRAETLTLLPLRPGQRVTTFAGVAYAQGNVLPITHQGTIRALTHKLPEGETTLTLRDTVY